MLSIDSVQVENLRGYYSAALTLTRRRILVVGSNNAGKTSILRLLNWVINQLDEELACQRRTLSPEEQALLLPRREARHRARRLTLTVKVDDGRSQRKFDCVGGRATLRVNVRLTPQPLVYLALGRPARGEKPKTQKKALELLLRLRDSLYFVHIPSFRDARSTRFVGTLKKAVKDRIEERALHSAKGGAPSEHRKVAKALKALQDVILSLANPLWEEVSTSLPPGMARDAVLDLTLDQSELLEFLESRLTLRVSTGKHDALAVPMPELGSGLQSLLDLAFQESRMPSDKMLTIAAEEPEAFLHPSAQRTVANRLLDSAKPRRQIILTTHSPIIVEEARYGDVVICRDHQFYEPAEVPEETRRSINTALLTGHGAEMVFGRAILLVEGEGDRLFFERLRRRVATHDASGRLDTCFVVDVGGKARFAPWIQLLNSYGSSSDRPIRWLCVADADASADLKKSFDLAQFTVPQRMVKALTEVDTQRKTGDFGRWRRSVESANAVALSTGTPLHFMSLDLEEAALSSAGPTLIRELLDQVEMDHNDNRDDLLRRLGAKAFGGTDGFKAPWLRAYMADRLEPSEISVTVHACLQRWFAYAMGEDDADAALQAWGT